MNINKKILASLLLIAFFISSPSFAEEKKDKPLAGYDKGFKLRSDDGAFELKIGGRQQVLYELETKETTAGATDQSFQHSFEIKSSRIQYGLKLFEKFNILGYYNASTQFANVPSWTIFSSYQFSPAFKLSFGIFGIPLDLQGPVSSAKKIWIENPVAINDKESGDKNTLPRDKFGYGFDLGIGIDGKIGRISYVIGVANGEGMYSLNANNEFTYGARLTFDIMGAVPFSSDYDFDYSETPKWTIGLGGVFEDDAYVETKTNANIGWNNTISLGSMFRWRGFALNAEGYYRRLKITDPGTAIVGTDGALTDVGYYLVSSYFVMPKFLEVGGIMSQVFREGPDNNMFEFGGVINWYPLKVQGVRWQFGYSYMLDYNQINGTNDQSQHYLRTLITIGF